MNLNTIPESALKRARRNREAREAYIRRVGAQARSEQGMVPRDPRPLNPLTRFKKQIESRQLGK